MLCILRVYGKALEEAQVSSELGLTPRNIKHEDGSVRLNYEVAESDDRLLLIEQTKKFVRDHGRKLQNLGAAQGVDEKWLDIAVGFPPTKVALFVRFDQEFVDHVSKAGLAVEVSVYKVSES